MHERPVFIPAAACILLATLPAAAANSNLITNGGFDLGPQPSYFATYQKGSTAIPGWVVTMGTVDLLGPRWHDADGGKSSIDLDGTPGPGAIAQSFATKPGSRYIVSFALASNPECGPVVKRMMASVGVVRNAYQFNSAHAGDSNMGWQAKSFTFVANAAHTTLTFTSLSKSSFCGAAIDAVRVWKVK